MAAINFKVIDNRGQSRIMVKFPASAEWDKNMKSVDGAQFSKQLKGWHIPDTAENRRKCGLPVTEPPQHVSQKKKEWFVNDANNKALEDMVKAMKKKKYSDNTIRIYRMELLQLMYLLGQNPINKLTTKQVSSYLLYCIEELGVKDHQMHLRVNAIKFYFQEVCNKDILPVGFSRPRNKSEVKSLNESDLSKIFEAVDNVKYKAIVSLAYSAGIRVSDISTIRVSDVDLKSNKVVIRKTASGKDKSFDLSKTEATALAKYMKEFKPEKYLFEGADGGAYSIRSIQHALKSSLQAARIRKKINTPGLSKTFEEHLKEQGADLAVIRQMLGHGKVEAKLDFKAGSKKWPLDILYNS